MYNFILDYNAWEKEKVFYPLKVKQKKKIVYVIKEKLDLQISKDSKNLFQSFLQNSITNFILPKHLNDICWI